MRILLVGVSCIGKSTLGEAYAKRYGYTYYDFDLEVEKRLGEPISFIKAKYDSLVPEQAFRRKVSPILNDILNTHPDRLVIAMPPSGMRGEYSRFIRKHQDVLTVELTDDPINIFNRLAFYDDYTQPIDSVINDDNAEWYFKDIKSDLSYYKPYYKKVKLKVHLNGRNIEQSLDYLDASIKAWVKNNSISS